MSVLDELEASRRAKNALVIMQLEDQMREDLLAYGIARGERVGSSGGGPTDPSDQWVSAIDSEPDRDERRRAAARALRNGKAICAGAGKVWPAAGRFLRSYYVDACPTWRRAFEEAGISESVGYKLRKVVLEWCEAAGRERVIAGVGIAEDRDGR